MYNLFGTSISDFGQKSIAKWLSYKILPSHFGSFKKIIAVDMDDTLHLGLLGEDGIENVLVSAAHRKFQEYLIHLKSEGFLLVLVTKNHLEDVLKLLDSEAYHIKSGDFIRIYTGWEPKAHYIGLALDELNLHESSLIFIDDNQGELANFSLIFPSADLIQAEPDANITTMRLEFTPGILRLVEDSEGKKREEDLTANVSRKTLSNIIEKKAEYLVALKPRVEFLKGEHLDLERFASQSLRTNQFNVNLAKFSVQKLEQVLETMEFDLVQIKYSDTFGDSGIIGSIAFKFEKNILTIDQVYISCRTLGRGIEFEILEELMFFIHQIHPSATRLRIFWRKSSRNEPALRWLEAFASKDLIGDFGMIEIECSKLSRADLFEVIYH
jgi:FkbH-like protein